MTTYHVTSGQVSNGITLSDGDFVYVSSGGTQLVASGDAVSTSVIGGGNEYAFSGGVADFTTLDIGGEQDVYIGASVISTTVGNGATEFLHSGATTTSTTVSSGGTQSVSSRGTTVSTTVDSSGTEHVFNRGTASGTTVSQGGKEILDHGGSAIGITVGDGGYQVVSSGGTATSTTVNSGGTQYADSGNLASDTVMNVDGSIDVSYLSYTSGGSGDRDGAGTGRRAGVGRTLRGAAASRLICPEPGRAGQGSGRSRGPNPRTTWLDAAHRGAVPVGLLSCAGGWPATMSIAGAKQAGQKWRAGLRATRRDAPATRESRSRHPLPSPSVRLAVHARGSRGRILSPPRRFFRPSLPRLH